MRIMETSYLKIALTDGNEVAFFVHAPVFFKMAAKLPMKFPSLDEGEAKQTIIWDPINSSDWDKVKPSGETVARIKR